jgi:type VI secretion system protein VasD
MGRWLQSAIPAGRVLAGVLALLAACSSPPPPPPPTVVDLTLTARADANPTAAGQGAPVALRVYQLASSAGLEGAEFFQIFNQDQSTLQGDLVKRDDFLLAPGQSKTASLKPPEQAKVLGVFAAWRDFQHAKWRVTTEIPPHQTTKITVLVGHDGLTLKSEPVPAKPGP